ncbi:MAG: hypothetical protein ACI8V2_001901 [Candidatus Latescibacterota bacterium]|jgi:hypothetical protein
MRYNTDNMMYMTLPLHKDVRAMGVVVSHRRKVHG